MPSLPPLNDDPSVFDPEVHTLPPSSPDSPFVVNGEFDDRYQAARYDDHLNAVRDEVLSDPYYVAAALENADENELTRFHLLIAKLTQSKRAALIDVRDDLTTLLLGLLGEKCIARLALQRLDFEIAESVYDNLAYTRSATPLPYGYLEEHARVRAIADPREAIACNIHPMTEQDIQHHAASKARRRAAIKAMLPTLPATPAA